MCEIAMATVQNEGLPIFELMIEHTREARVPALGHPSRETRRELLVGTVVDVEVRRPQNLKIVIVVCDFVATELLRLRRRAHHLHCGECDREHHHCSGQTHTTSSSRSRRV